MGKYEKYFNGNFDSVVSDINSSIVNGSASANLEDSSLYTSGEVKVAVLVFERYSFIGGNRVSLSVTIVGNGNNLFISGITAGGSQAVFFKINTFGEEAFLDCLKDALARY